VADDSGLVVVRTSFFAGNTLVRGGDVWAADDPVVKHYPAAFRPLEVHRSKPQKAPVTRAEPKAAPKRTFGRKS
jgi:hypothetical protein